jgi:N-acylglucosamine-6-phosphate 2-epimerase
MHEPPVIAAMAVASVRQGAVGVRIESPAHVAAVRQQVSVPVIGLWKQPIPGFEVYITPQFHHAHAIAQAGADIIAIDATTRPRPNQETITTLIAQIHTELGKPVMADVDSLEAGLAAANAGADLVGTTLYGYTAATKTQTPPGFDLVAQLNQYLAIPIICEGGIASPHQARRALDLGAFAIVVGTAITGVDLQVKAYCKALSQTIDSSNVVKTLNSYRVALLEQANPVFQDWIGDRLNDHSLSQPDVAPLFTSAGLRDAPLNLVLLDQQQTVMAGLVGYTRWDWLTVNLLWVNQSLRHQGYGAHLLQLAEQAAKQRHCKFSRLSTFSFQARGFYEKQGYEVYGQLADFPPGQVQYCLRKNLE